MYFYSEPNSEPNLPPIHPKYNFREKPYYLQKIKEDRPTTRQDWNDWLVNIENTASFIESENGVETVDFVLKKYGAKSIEQIASFDLSEVFSELYAIEADLRSG